VDATLAPYGPDSKDVYSNDGVTILYRAFHTTKESRHEAQPHVAASGSVIAWDGNLDNRAELIRELADVLPFDPSDVVIVAAAYEKWGGACFAKLIGDWALSIWNSMERCLILAKDPIGTHHLYYTFHDKQVTWSTILDPLVRFGGKTFSLNEEYIAGCFSMFPATHLTPCRAVHTRSTKGRETLRQQILGLQFR
jgi:asparagine synthase (glutamine-hydrolysing)